MVMRRVCGLLLALLVLTVGGAYAASTGKIVGRVVDTKSGEPLINANIVVDQTTMGATTDLDGNFFILNVPPGTYELKCTMLNYHPATYSNVRVSSDRTTIANFKMTETVIQLAEDVVFVAKKPMIRKDATDSRTTRTAEELKLMPVENVKEIVKLTAGVIGENVRGGRETEVNYMVDGTSFIDPLTGDYEGFIPSVAFEEVNIITGGQSAEYGNSLSGVVHQVTKEGTPKVKGNMQVRSNDLGGSEVFVGQRDRMKDVQGSLSGPIPFFDGLGDLSFLLSGQFFDTRGRFDNDDSTLTSSFGKLTYKISPKHKLTFSGTVSNAQYAYYSHLWKNNTIEDQLFQFDPNDPQGEPFVENGVPWYGNGQLDTEDKNGNFKLDPGEDLDNDGILDSEDLNNDGQLSEFRMLDHLPYYTHHTEQFAVKWNHAISSRTFYEINLSRYKTAMTYNTRERINEDANGNGLLDMEGYYDVDEAPDNYWDLYDYYWDANGEKVWFDVNGNGSRDWEDLNGNGLWDWDEYGPDHDLFVDTNNDGYIDASQGEGVDEDDWIPWEELPFGNARDREDYYLYGAGTTYNRARWNEDYKIIWTAKGSLTSQVHKFHQIKAGFELRFMELFDHDVDLASGGNVYGQNMKTEPRQYGIWLEDKMEFEGMVLNAGMRFDVFDVNWDDYPSDITNPVTDPSVGGEVNDPTSVDAKYEWGPRLGIAFPITERDLLSFNYSRNFQIPILRFAYTNINWDLTGAFPIIGNPNLDPEQTTAYEITLRHQFTSDLAVTATGFYKDISGLTDTRQVFYTVTNWYGLYINQDYGNVRGFEISLDKRFSNFYSGNLSYTYAVAKGKSSDARQNYENAWADNLIRTTESYLDWDQRHTIYGNIQFMIPEGTKLWGMGFLDQVSTSLIGKYGSGLPYSSPARDKDPPVNDKRLPYTLTFDARLQKRHSFSKNVAMLAYLQVYNLFDRSNMDQRFFQDNADTSWYQADQDGDGSPDYDVDGKYDDPRYYQRGRYFQFGVGIEF